MNDKENHEVLKLKIKFTKAHREKINYHRLHRLTQTIKEDKRKNETTKNTKSTKKKI
jgi:hypothetical protein